MTTIKSTSGKKLVNISKTETGYIAMYCQLSGDDFEQVLESKRLVSLKGITNWANKKLGL